MSDRNHYLKEWREYRGLTQAQLANSVGTNANVISELEHSKRRLSDKWLQKFAIPLQTRPGAILDYDPKDVNNDLLEIWGALTEENKSKAIIILKALAG